MEIDREGARLRSFHVTASPSRPRLLLVHGDLGRRATLAVALAARYVVDSAPAAPAAYARATLASFDVAVLDAAVLGATLPRLVRILRRRSRAVRLVIIAGRRDVRGQHYAGTLGVDAKLGRRAPTYALIDRIAGLGSVAERRAGFDRRVGRAIDLMARDVTHLLDIHALADATGVTLALLGERFFAETGLTVHEYVTRVRVTVGEHLLHDTDVGVATLADLLGFANAADLARAAAPSRLQP